MKQKGTAYGLWCLSLIGICGVNRFYLGKIGTGILWLLTGGLLGIGALYDLITTSSQVDDYNLKYKALYCLPGYQQQNVVVNVVAPYYQQPQQ